MTDSIIIKAFETVARALRVCQSEIPTDELEDVIREMKQPRCREAEGESEAVERCMTLCSTMGGPTIREAMRECYRSGFRAGRSQPIDGFYRDGVHRKDCPCAECNGNADRKEQPIHRHPNRGFMDTAKLPHKEQPPPASDDDEQTCPDCDGAGYLGVCRDGRKQSCEACGGHEDSLGTGRIAKQSADEDALPVVTSNSEDEAIGWRLADGMVGDLKSALSYAVATGRSLGRAEVLEKERVEKAIEEIPKRWHLKTIGEWEPGTLQRMLRDFVEQLKRGGE